ncbi:Thiamin biosynthesis lipoprotein ApbE [Methylophaga frappieri]|uniref:FAD:protein FMN transferase n=1 Tax=Methylophaga frappieri (strain ATCC BAA-2434 / DSM 25690 / JAM7) TaxID=754477 RepID=I1YK82_METFJ|nr:FAD:protein FMN transferase [Methylophaga frappieri]AFJ03325.1 Thiamin biosynthesis lipoprotein ApbE [Methylophaga frappieri]
MRLILLWVSLVLLTACQDSTTQQAKIFAFGTEIDISIYNEDRATFEQAITDLETTFTGVNDLWHAWQPSLLTEINAAIAAGEPIAVDENVAEVIAQAQALAKDSEQLFNPAAGQLFSLWGFEQDDWFSSRPPPQSSAINAWLAAAPDMTDIVIREDQLYSDNPMAKLGFGGFAKGYAVDAAIDLLKARQIDNAIVNIGGDLRAIGQHGRRAWNIGIRHPRQEGVLASVEVRHDESVFSSGDYERFFEYDGKRYSHILDPRSGYPADQAMSVTVIDNNAARADAAATALFVAGNDWPKLAAKMGLEAVMLVTASGQLELSPVMAERIKIINYDGEPRIRSIR